jgi:drug/metabolite transporter (DMT)-like permease
LLHLVVLIFGFTGILGKLITVPALVLVWYRLIIAVIAILIYLKVMTYRLKVDRKLTIKALSIGVLVGIHWVFFFHSIKVSSVSIALICLASGPFIIAIIEPILHRHRFRRHELVFSLVNLFGIAIIYNFESKYVLGILFGVLAAFLGGLFTILNGNLVKNNDASIISLYELIGAWITLSVIAPWVYPVTDSIWRLSGPDWFYLLLLGTICTAFAYMASIHVMRVVSPFTTLLTVNLEPIYGIILALVIFGSDETMSPGFYLGAVIVIITIYLNGFVNRKLKTTELEG